MKSQKSSPQIVDPIFRDAILGKVIKYSMDHNHMFTLEELQSLDPQFNPDYEQAYTKFIQHLNNNLEITSFS